MSENEEFNVENLISRIERGETLTLKEFFELRLDELSITVTNSAKILKINYRALIAILEGKQRNINIDDLFRIADFLQLSTEKVIQLYLTSLEKNTPRKKASITAEKIQFIKEHFDLMALRKAGFIESTTDFDVIEKRLTEYLGIKSIFEYKKPSFDIALSAGAIKPKNELTRIFWINTAIEYFQEINNPNEYNRQALIDYFPKIRWHSTNIEIGLLDVIKELYKIGVTVIYQAPLPTLHLRGATFSINNKPCIVLTNYRGFYPTLWFALIHELHHVLFDWNEIMNNAYHLSDDDNKNLAILEREKKADKFAREYLFSIDKTTQIRPYIRNEKFVTRFAKDNHVHSSFIYVFNAYDLGHPSAWSLAYTKTPPFDTLLASLVNPWDNAKPISEHINSLKFHLYN